MMALSPWQAIGISVASLAAGWAIYDAACRSPLGRNTGMLGVFVFALILAARGSTPTRFPGAARSFMLAPSSAPSWRRMFS
ncbi:MAG: urate hydroxylase PuuD [Rhizobiales bacterium]|nr:urate hydroxylase PuuD [Hyphomicrobiales bacterium]